ncbi:hypothetical protein BDZ97DRAFT_1668665 [Flammula alnicola]|nr:hypothetical protein BDZ97DRAFT_1668665 [Flammula alnicola]
MRPGQTVNIGDEEEVVLDPGDDTSDDSDDDVAANEEADASIEEVEDDEGQAVHNDRVAKTIREKAIEYMETDKGIVLDPREVKMALQIFPRVSGLARRVHDSSTLKEKFDKLVSDTDSLKGNRQALIHRVPTRWNSDLDCLLSHFYFKEVIEQLTAIQSLGLKKYSLSSEQWKMAEDVREILLVSKFFNSILYSDYIILLAL